MALLWSADPLGMLWPDLCCTGQDLAKTPPPNIVET